MYTQGDASFSSFARARDAVAAAVSAQRRLADTRGRMVRRARATSLHAGEPVVGRKGYLGIGVVRAARICAADHGGRCCSRRPPSGSWEGRSPRASGSATWESTG